MEQRTADLLITGAEILTFDDASTVVHDGAIAITGNSISWLGKSDEAAGRFLVKDTLKADGMIAMPGLVDCHVHTAQQFLRGKLASLGYIGSLREPIWKRYLIPFESGLEPEDIYCSGLCAYSSMISCGTTCFLEAGGPFPDEMGRAADEIGIRGRIAMSTMDLDDTLPKGFRFTTEEALQRSEALVKRWEHHPRVNAWLALRQIIVNSQNLRIEMDALARQLNTRIHTHLCEGTYEIDYTVDHFGKRPAEYLHSLGVFNDRLHCAHSVLLGHKEIDLYAANDVSSSHCAMNNFIIGAPHLFELVRRNVRVGLGTDGAATRGTLDLFQVAHYAVHGMQILDGTPMHGTSPMSYTDMLRQAVRGGARAAHLESQIGSLEPGKRADLILINAGDFDQYPVYDPVITAAEQTVGRDVQTVIIDGQIVMKDRQLLTVDLGPMRESVKKQYAQIMERFDRAIA
ncbi:MAG TPA: amidohydrolase family protein [Candidatus Acidoferrum sp.]|nr:amidohydrolase family protein [Candidatus Acidoferrum sp.]